MTEQPREQLMATPHWSVELHPDQAYLGRFLVLSRDSPASNLSELSLATWANLQEVIVHMESGAKDAFNAKMLNWSYLMNHDASGKLPPRVRWHVRPRYDRDVEFFGKTFRDLEYGKHYSLTRKKLVSPKLLQEIATRFRNYL